MNVAMHGGGGGQGVCQPISYETGLSLHLRQIFIHAAVVGLVWLHTDLFTMSFHLAFAAWA
jgi:hypothetical protein